MPPVFSKLQRPWPGLEIDVSARSWGVLRQCSAVVALDAIDLESTPTEIDSSSDDSDVVLNVDDVVLTIPGCVLPVVESQEFLTLHDPVYH